MNVDFGWFLPTMGDGEAIGPPYRQTTRLFLAQAASPSALPADGDFLDHDERYARTQEFMQVVRKAWTEPKKWDWDGTYYKVERGDVHPKPYTKPHSPFYFGGASE